MFGCLLVASFPVACEVADQPELAGLPVAVAGESGRLEAVSAAADEHGVQPGLTPREALGRCPALAVLQARPVRYAAAWDEILRAVERVAYTLQPAGPGLVHVAVDELLPHHGSVDAVLAALLGCASPALEPRVGAAPARFAALLAARQAPAGGRAVVAEADLPDFMGRQPVPALPVPDEMQRRLRLLGLRTLGELRALRRPTLAAQFGPEGALAWELAHGRDREPLRPWRRQLPLVERLRLDPPATGRPALLVAWEQTLGRLVRQTGFRGLTARQADLRAATERGRRWSRTITFKEPLADSRRMWPALRVALEEAQFPGPLSELAVELRGLAPALGQQLALPSARSALRGRLEEGLRQLKARYGYCPVGRVVEVEPWNRVPERRLALIDYDL